MTLIDSVLYEIFSLHYETDIMMHMIVSATYSIIKKFALYVNENEKCTLYMYYIFGNES